MENVSFHNIKSEKIKKLFLQALEGYPDIKGKKIELIRRKLKKTTMRAQPVLKTFFGKKENRRYKVEFNKKVKMPGNIPISDLDDEVLLGWFAHELGHVLDYQRHGFFGMIKFGILYLISSNFRIGCERRADLYAIAHGFSDAILATKEFILEKSTLSNRYKSRIRKYYMSADEVLLIVADKEEEKLRMDKLDIFNTDQ